MRILIVNSEHPPVGGGAGNASANLAEELVSMGERVAVLTSRYNDFPIDSREEGVRIYRCLSQRRFEDRSSPREQFLFMLGGLTDGVRFIRQWSPDVIITFFGIPSGPVGLAAKTLFGIPYVVSLRGGDVPGFRPYDFKRMHRILGPLIHLVWKHAGCVVANSRGLKELANKFSPEVPIKVIPNGVNIDEFSPRKRSWKDPELLFVGRIVYQKGLDLLIKALSTLRDLNWQLTIVGDGPYLSVIQALAAELKINDRITFAGWVQKDQIEGYYQKANLFVFPSRHEGMSNALLEAMAMGLPVVASDIAGNDELVVPEKTGLLFEKNDLDALTADMRALIEHPELRRQFGNRSRERISAQYTWNNTARGYLEVCQDLVQVQ
jgi:glycosyltransferase involved in cell wall biosynthesis